MPGQFQFKKRVNADSEIIRRLAQDAIVLIIGVIGH